MEKNIKIFIFVICVECRLWIDRNGGLTHYKCTQTDRFTD